MRIMYLPDLNAAGPSSAVATALLHDVGEVLVHGVDALGLLLLDLLAGLQAEDDVADRRVGHRGLVGVHRRVGDERAQAQQRLVDPRAQRRPPSAPSISLYSYSASAALSFWRSAWIVASFSS